MSESQSNDERGMASATLSAILSAAILSAAIGVAVFTFFTEPTARRAGATKQTAMLVEVTEVDRGNYRPKIVAQGTIEPAREVMLRPQVGGRVVSRGDNFTPGGYVEKGDKLLRIEPADFRHTLAQRKGDLEQARADLAVAKGRREAAQAEYDYLDDRKLSTKNKKLLLREPQLEAAKQRVEAARAAVDQARLNLNRTRLEAPFDAHILTREANVGSQISPNEPVARLVGLERFWVSIELPLSKMRWLSVEADGDSGSMVRIRNPEAWPDGASREGRLFRRVSALDGETRMVRLLAEVENPLARNKDHSETPPLVIGEFVEATIEGETMRDVVRLARDYIRKDDTVWTMQKGKLRINDVEIALKDPEYAYITEGLDDGADVVTTNISTVVEGAALRLERETNSSSSEEEDTP